MKELTIVIIETTLLLLSGFGIGWFGNELYKEIKADRIMDGLYIQDQDFKSAYEISTDIDSNGDWVCINTNGMDFSRGIEVCSHECGHAVYSEIYAEMCEKDSSKCIKEMENEKDN